MSYKLKFHEEGKREWDKLDWTIRKQFPPALEKRLPSHRVQSAKLLDAPDCYKSYIVRVLATINRASQISYSAPRRGKQLADGLLYAYCRLARTCSLANGPTDHNVVGAVPESLGDIDGTCLLYTSRCV